MPINVPQSIQIILFSLEMNSTHRNKNFDVLQAILGQKIVIFSIFTDFAGAVISAAILVNRATIAEIPPSGFFIPKVSKSQNKCQNL